MEEEKVISSLRMAELIKRYLDDTLEENESAELSVWINDAPEHPEFFKNLVNEHNLEQYGKELKSFNTINALTAVKSKLTFTPAIGKVRLWPRIAVAAAAVATILFGIWFFNDSGPKKGQDIIVYQNDIKPGKNMATLTLDNGKKIVLSDAVNGKLAEEAGVRINKTADGQLIYEIASSRNALTKQSYNTLSTTKGETYVVKLPDGSLVHLNAESSLKYPVSFANTEIRKVEMKGEAYFEVAKSYVSLVRGRRAKQSFIVQTDRQTVEVLGTHFNINSYSDEASTKTTLLEGSVRLNGNTILKPGEQASLSPSGAILVAPVNVNKAVAWKNGKFIFENENIQSIMKKLSRWYDVEVVYEGDFSDRTFTGSISRDSNISKILNKIILTQAIHFKIEGRRITVMP